MALVSPTLVKLVGAIKLLTASPKYIQATMFWTIRSSSFELSSIKLMMPFDSIISQTLFPLICKSCVHCSRIFNRVSNMHCLVLISFKSVYGFTTTSSLIIIWIVLFSINSKSTSWSFYESISLSKISFEPMKLKGYFFYVSPTRPKAQASFTSFQSALSYCSSIRCCS